MDILAHALWAGAGAELLRRHSYMTSSEARAIVLLAVIGFDVLELMDAVEDFTGLDDNGTEVPNPPRDDDV